MILAYDSKKRLWWNMFLVLNVFMAAFEIPIEIFMGHEAYEELSFSMKSFTTIVFTVDIFVNLRTSYYDEHEMRIVKEPKKIAKAYICSWKFLFDLLSVIPTNFLLSGLNIPDEKSKYLALFGIFKFSKLSNLGKDIMLITLPIGFTVILALPVITILLILIHWMACILYASVIKGEDWIPPMDLNKGET